MSIEVSQAEQTNLVTLDGYVDETDGPRLKEVLENKIDKKLNTLFLVNSPGGQFETGPVLIKIIKTFQTEQIANGKAVTGYVGDQNQCASLCTVIFLHFQYRLLAPEVRFGYHAPNFFGLPMVDEIKQIKEMYHAAAVEHKNEKFSTWLAKYPSLLEESDITWFSAEKLIAENSGVSTSSQLFPSVREVISYLGAL